MTAELLRTFRQGVLAFVSNKHGYRHSRRGTSSTKVVSNGVIAANAKNTIRRPDTASPKPRFRVVCRSDEVLSLSFRHSIVTEELVVIRWHCSVLVVQYLQVVPWPLLPGWNPKRCAMYSDRSRRSRDETVRTRGFRGGQDMSSTIHIDSCREMEEVLQSIESAYDGRCMENREWQACRRRRPWLEECARDRVLVSNICCAEGDLARRALSQVETSGTPKIDDPKSFGILSTS